MASGLSWTVRCCGNQLLVWLCPLDRTERLPFGCPLPSGINWEHPRAGCILFPHGCPSSTSRAGWKPCASAGHSCHCHPPGAALALLALFCVKREHFGNYSTSPAGATLPALAYGQPSATSSTHSENCACWSYLLLRSIISIGSGMYFMNEVLCLCLHVLYTAVFQEHK